MKKLGRKAPVILALILALAMLGLAACGDGGAPAEVATPGQPTPTPPPTAQDDDDDDEGLALVVVPPRDLGGREISLLCWWQYWEETGAEEPDPATSEDYLIDRLRWENRERIERDFNVTIASPTVGWGQMLGTLTASVMAGDPVADMVLLNGGWQFSAIMGNIIQPGSNFITPESDLAGPRNFVVPRVTFEGDIWSFWHNEPWSGDPLGVNLDIINALGVESPVDLFNRGAWTWDAFREIMQMATRDTDGDGLVDQFGISGQPTSILYALIGANDGMLVCPDTRTYALDHPHTLRALEFFYQIFGTDRTWQYDRAGGEDFLGHYARNMNVFREGNSAFFYARIWQFTEEMPTFNYTVVPWPQGPDNTRGYTFLMPWPYGVTIPVGVANPADALLIFEQMHSWPGERLYLMHEGYMNYFARRGLLTEDCAQRLMNDVGPTGKQDLGLTIGGGFGNIAFGFAHDFWTGEATVSVAIEARRLEYQSIIDTAFGVSN